MASNINDKIITNSLSKELNDLVGLNNQSLDTGQYRDEENELYLKYYTTRLFGSPFQLLDSVDTRFSEINKYVGNEYLRNFLLNSPILNIRPGLPKYTGNKDEDFLTILGELYLDVTGQDEDYNNGLVYNVLMQLAKNGPFGYGSKLQKRFYNFKESYAEYCHYVNYMCRSVAKFLKLTTRNKYFPNGTFCTSSDSNERNEGNSTFQRFDNIRWENYRFRSDSYVKTMKEYFKSLATLGKFDDYYDSIENGYNELYYNNSSSNNMEGEAINNGVENTGFDTSDINSLLGTSEKVEMSRTFDEYSGTQSKGSTNAQGAYGVMSSKVTCVQFMVEPTDFSESYSNETAPSMIEQAIDGIQQSIGSEVAWITNSDVNGKIMDGFLDGVGNAVDGVLGTIGQLANKISSGGGFVSNLFSGAIRSLRGQKMIYPNIYKSSNSSNNYRFTINLKSPYGDVYNYYMNIVVPWLHMLALTAPRMVTSNSINSPFLVQAYIPGMATIQMGIIKSLSFERNPEGKYISTSGFPNSAKITLEIEELYNAMAISPDNDPASFMYNETLNDYMCNLAGLIPSIETNDKQRRQGFTQFSNWISGGGLGESAATIGAELIEDYLRPY